MCEYRYSGSYCAHRGVTGRNCVGESNCHVHGAKHNWAEHDCSKEQWYGLYCAKYQRFYCAGHENCATPQQYMDSLIRFRSEGGRP